LGRCAEHPVDGGWCISFLFSSFIFGSG
jgi:hypothetical protein